MNTFSADVVEAPAAGLENPAPAVLPGLPEPETAERTLSATLPRPAWVEIDLGRLKRNFELINGDKPPGLQVLSVVKDEAYGHGALAVARTALACGAKMLALSTLEEAVALRDRGIQAPLLLLGDREDREFAWCLEYDLTCCVSDAHSVTALGQAAARAGKRVPVHLKINTGMNRYGVRLLQESIRVN